MKNGYTEIINIRGAKFQEKKVLLIGAGWMANQYAKVLLKMKITNVTVISNSKEKTKKFCEKYNFIGYSGGYKKNLVKMEKADLVIITPPIEITIDATKEAIKNGQTNILIEKPSSLYKEEIKSLEELIKNQRVRIAYNRVVYPNYLKLKELIKKDGGITSCKFTITERIRDLTFPKKGNLDVHKRLGVYNSIHVISMVIDLIGIPKNYQFMQYGKLKWHPTGAVFIGSGITNKKIPFSYHGDWLSSGRWGIEIMTVKHAYKMISLEELFVAKVNKDVWKKVSFKKAYPDLKQGVAEEIAIMLDKKLEKYVKIPTIKKALEISQITEEIFGYSKK